MTSSATGVILPIRTGRPLGILWTPGTTWALFVGHLVLEKLLKALYVQLHNSEPPRIHDLTRLAVKCELELDSDALDKFDVISRFNIGVRYPDYQQELYRICSREYSQDIMQSIEGIRAWLLKLIKTS